MINKRAVFTIIILLFGALGNYIRAQGNSSIIFIENKGQWPDEVKFYADIPGGMLFIENNDVCNGWLHLLASN